MENIILLRILLFDFLVPFQTGSQFILPRFSRNPCVLSGSRTCDIQTFIYLTYLFCCCAQVLTSAHVLLNAAKHAGAKHIRDAESHVKNRNFGNKNTLCDIWSLLVSCLWESKIKVHEVKKTFVLLARCCSLYLSHLNLILQLISYLNIVRIANIHVFWPFIGRFLRRL